MIRETTYVVRNATTAFERLLLSLSYSVRVYGIIFVLAALDHQHSRDVSAFIHGRESLWNYLVVGVLALLVLPVLISESGRWWLRSGRVRPWALRTLRISSGHGTPSGWDHFFSSNKFALVRITLDDGRVIGGYFGRESLAAYSEETGDLFLEQRWVLDADSWFKEPAAASLGVWVPHEHIVSVEVYEPPAPPREPNSEGPVNEDADT